MSVALKLGDMSVDVVRKNIKNIHLSVYPPAGRVRVSAPNRIGNDALRVYVISKLDWIRKQQDKIRKQPRETPREYINRESHYFRGERYLLSVIERNTSPCVELLHSTIRLYVRPGASFEKRRDVIDEWYREQLKQILPEIIRRYEKAIGIKVREFGIKKMKTRWGTCNAKARRIWLNLELAKKPIECLEYIVVHEMAHLIEPTHNARFVAVMDKYMPKWKFYKAELNRLPVKHEEWEY